MSPSENEISRESLPAGPPYESRLPIAALRTKKPLMREATAPSASAETQFFARLDSRYLHFHVSEGIYPTFAVQTYCRNSLLVSLCSMI